MKHNCLYQPQAIVCNPSPDTLRPEKLRQWDLIRKLLYFLVCAVVVCLFTGCASTQQYENVMGSPNSAAISELAPSNGKAKIYVLRRYKFTGSGIAIRIADTGRSVGKIGAGGIVVWEREPGQVVIGASASNESNITITVKEGEVYFVEAKSNWGAGFNTAACQIRLLSNEEGQAMLASLQGR